MSIISLTTGLMTVPANLTHEHMTSLHARVRATNPLILNNFLNQQNPFSLQPLPNRITHLPPIRRHNTRNPESFIALKDQLRSNTARHAHRFRHGGIPVRVSIELECGGGGFLQHCIGVNDIHGCLSVKEGGTFLPSCHSTTNLCYRITRSRSRSW